jgi:hypothetical protein
MLEGHLINGGARWIADLSEFFRNYAVDDTMFDLYAKGATRNRGFLMSRFFSTTALPNYSVSLFCINETGSEGPTTDRLRKRVDAVISQVKRKNLKWAWLIVFSGRKLSPQAVAFVSRYERKELGLALASISSGQLVVSSNQLGTSLERRFGLGKLLRRLKDGKTL